MYDTNKVADVQQRRAFLKSGLGLGGSLFVGCGEEAPLLIEQPADGSPAAPSASDSCAALEGGRLLGLESFIGESTVPYEVAFNDGLDGRLYTDLTRIQPDNLDIPNDAFYVRTRLPDQIDFTSPWSIALADERGNTQRLEPEELARRQSDQGTHVLECSGNSRGAGFGLLSSARWDGVSLLQILEELELVDSSRRVLVSGFDGHSQPSANNHSTPGASWIFSFDDLANTGAFLATQMNGSELPLDHGWPVRLFVPGWYGCTCIKWVDRIELVDDDVAATSQMQEFASRIHQSGTPSLARDYAPANMHVAAMPTRVERWRIGDEVIHRMLGIVWGGAEPVNDFEVRIGSAPWRPVSLCAPRDSTQSWSLWEHVFAAAPGRYDVVLRASDPSVPQRRLNSEFYLREFEVSQAS